MNHIYRSIWNSKTRTFTAVSENTKTGGKQACAGTSVVTGAGFVLKALATSLLLAFGSISYAMPVGGVVAAGSASVTSGNGSMTVNQTSQNVVLNWQSFNIGATEAVRFVQPNSSSVALNRVIGADPSSILGSLSANGKVFLVNPNGILFGKGASVNVGGLVASTLNISDSDFMAGNYKFAGNGSGSGSVINQGSINADGGFVALLGANISNEGIINARLGSVTLAAGNAITLDVVGDGLLSVAINEGAVHALVSNGGMIRADGGHVLMTAQAAGNLLQTVVNNTGVIQAQTIENHNGVIKLLGDMQSGTVNVGGKLDASAPDGGDGGFIETSAAHVQVADGARVTTRAVQGQTGTWLIDPTDFTIAAGSGAKTTSSIGADTLSSNLDSNNVRIETVASGSENGDIHVNSVVSWSANELTLSAHGDININASLNGSGTAKLALEYGQSAVAAGNTADYRVNAAVNLAAGENFSTKLGNDGTVVQYQVITDLGAAGDIGASSLQGINGNLAGNYVLGSNIDASATSGWNSGAGFAPIVGAELVTPTRGNPYTKLLPFTGIFDGLGHTINGLVINQPDASSVGMFSSISYSVIRNVGLLGGSVSGKASVGGLVGSGDRSTITQTYNTGAVTGAGNSVGGLVGYNAYGTISQAYTTGAVSGAGISVGGLVGYSYRGTLISQSYATGAVSGGSSINQNAVVGGLVGQNVLTPITEAYATGTVSGVGKSVGGLVGFNNGSEISNAYATGRVTGNYAVGGLVGQAEGGRISNAYATGAVSGASNVGGLIGTTYLTYTPIVNSYWDSYSTGRAVGVGNASPAGITAVTSDPMQSNATNYAFKQSAYAGFDFTADTGGWFMVDGSTRPFLQSEYSTTITNTHQLQLMAMGLAASYTLANDIDATATARAVNSATAADASGMWSNAGFAPVGTAAYFSGGDIISANPFTGRLDGLGHTISELTIKLPETDGVGMFGQASGADLRNIGLLGGSITGHTYVGGLVGVSRTNTINGAYTTGAVSATGNVAGGLVGDSNSSTISESYATGAVSGGNGVGGLVGQSQTDTISAVYATGAVSGDIQVGGLIGYYYGGTITEAYATGAISGGSEVGGLIGYLHPASSPINGGYWNIDSSGRMNGVGSGSATGITGLTATQMKTASAFSGLDLTNTWVIYDTYTNPLLRSFMTALTVTANSASKTYDGLNYSGGNGVSYSSTNNGNLLGTLSYGGNSQGSVNAGSYAITPSGLYSTNQQGGYAITFVSGTLTINPPASNDNSADPTGTSVENGGNTTKVQSAIANASSTNFANSNGNNIASSLVSFGLGVSNVSTAPTGTSADSMLAGLNITVKDQGVNLPFGEQDKDKKDIAD